MTNQYFSASDYTALTANSLARSSQVNAIASAVVAGFDKLPDPDLVKQDRITYAASVGGTANAITLTLTNTISSYTAGLTVKFKAAWDNTSSTTVNVDSVGVKTVKTPSGAALTGGEIQADAVVELAYNGTDFTLLSGWVSADQTTLAAIASDVTTVAGISANVTTVAGISANVTTVAGIASDVTTVAASVSGVGALAAIADLAKTDGNFIVGNGTTWVAESGATVRASLGLTIGTDVQAYDADLAAVAALSSTGLVARTGTGAAAARTIAGTANEITVANGDGVGGNPTASLPSALTFTGKTVTGGTFDDISISGTVTLTGMDAAGWVMSDTAFYLHDSVNGPSDRVRFDVPGTASQTRIVSLPASLLTGDVTLVARNSTDTLTNKTLTAPTINNGTIDGAVIGGSARAAGSFTTLGSSGAAQLGSAIDGVIVENSSGAFSVGNAAYIRRNSSTGDLEIYASSSAARNLIFGSSNGAEDMRIDSSGRLLIGTSVSGAYLLDVAGLVRFQSSATIASSSSLNFGTSNTAGLTGVEGGSGYLSAHTNGSERVRVTAAGEVRVGTTSPQVGGSEKATILSSGSGEFGLGIKTANDGAPLALWQPGDNSGARTVIAAYGRPGASLNAVFRWTTGDAFDLVSSGADISFTPGSGKYLILNNVPTSSAGLPTGALWANSNVLTIVP